MLHDDASLTTLTPTIYSTPTAIAAAGNTNLTLTNFPASDDYISFRGATNATRKKKLARPIVTFDVAANAGSGAYVATLTLQSTGAIAGDQAVVRVSLAASNNQSVYLQNLTSGGTTIGNAYGNGVARVVAFRCMFDGTNWNVISRSPRSETFVFTSTSAPGGTSGAGTTGSPYVFAYPVGARAFHIWAVGAGAGGGSGRRGAAGTSRGGGGGGGAGNVRERYYDIDVMQNSAINIRVAAGGAGGAAVTANDTNGNDGTVSLDTRIHTGFDNPLFHAECGSGGGGGGTTSGGAGGQSDLDGLDGSAGWFNQGSKGGAGGSASNASSSANVRHGGPAGGSGGGGLTTGNAFTNGAAGGRAYINWSSDSGTAGSTDGAAGGAAGDMRVGNVASGGGGGAGSVAGAGGAGGKGGSPGGGGGGGGASVNGQSSGAGGNGGDGIARIIVFF